jgi:exopolysaccharide production protein ExoZ
LPGAVKACVHPENDYASGRRIVQASQMSQSDRLSTLQVFRGVAALLVVLYHATVYSQEQLGYSFLGGAFLFGHTGVDFFFVLSGFIIYYIHRQDIGVASRFQPYAIKRLLRVFPVYWIVTGIKLAVITIVPTLAKSYERDPLVIVKSFLLLPQVNLPLIGAAWTLTYELLFYGFFGIVILLNRRWALRLAIIWVAGTLLYNAARTLQLAPPGGLLLDVLFHERNLEFGLGCLSAHLILRGKVPLTRVLVLFGLALFVWAAWRIANGYLPLYYSPIFGLASFLVVTGSTAYELRHRPRMPRALVFLGDASYSIYLTHVMLINAVTLAFRRLGLQTTVSPLVTTLLVLVLVIVAASLFYWVVERPLLRWLSRRRPAVEPLARIVPSQP